MESFTFNGGQPPNGERRGNTMRITRVQREARITRLTKPDAILPLVPSPLLCVLYRDYRHAPPRPVFARVVAFGLEGMGDERDAALYVTAAGTKSTHLAYI